MPEDHQGILVHAMTPVHRRGPVFYASLPLDTKTPMGQGTNGDGAKRRLVTVLWDHLVKMGNPLSTSHLASSRSTFPLRVTRDLLGKPHLLLGAHRGPAISFTQGGGRVWAAISGDDSELGIDVAETVEFEGGYPVHRAFHRQELQRVSHLAGGHLEKALALLWSVKEAVVKALGCAFHYVDPLDIHVCPSAGEGEGPTFRVRFSGKALARFTAGAGLSLWVRSFPQVEMCLSMALLDRHVDVALPASMRCACSYLATDRGMRDRQPLPDPPEPLSRKRRDLE